MSNATKPTSVSTTVHVYTEEVFLSNMFNYDVRSDADTPITIVVDVTPKLAKYWLENRNNCNVRPKNARRSEEYARTIDQKKWTPTSHFRFRRDGEMADGQTRAAAVVKANKTVRMLVQIGLTEEEVRNIDTGRVRGKSQQARAAHIAEPTRRTPIARVIWELDTSNKVVACSMPSSDMFDILHKDEESITWAINNFSPREPGKTALVGAFAYVYSVCPVTAQKVRNIIKGDTPSLSVHSASARLMQLMLRSQEFKECGTATNKRCVMNKVLNALKFEEETRGRQRLRTLYNDPKGVEYFRHLRQEKGLIVVEDMVTLPA